MHLTKHHGLGNDFLVLLDIDSRALVDGVTARQVCARHRGVGADGLIVVIAGVEAKFRMILFNEDGSRAELSGNGISCLGQALVRAGLASDRIEVETDAGLRTIEVVETISSTEHRMRVAMGVPTIGGERPEWHSDDILHAIEIDVGNPHLVCHVADHALAPDLEALGRAANLAFADGVNVELISPGPGVGEITMTVYERGVGPTEACGTGAVASALAARSLGLAGDQVTVHQPGGAAVVELGEPVHLTVPVEAVAEVQWLLP